ncbi:formylglycine-generating enzyme family protein [Candidatus Thiodictyon syntrophicum]|uniref:formylglycine-generating enzyme family protein n=1 Tax=Candidatus Thiodictyon syntrophicum TaxID=1166950 RepID=UPI0012FE67C9|nr:SUMF1/EgtB/PvdO family nonheme iron enzyme [Candidatus Thiodictyon syntrophicum]
MPVAPGTPAWQTPGGVSAGRRTPGLLARIGRALRGAGRGAIGRVERIARYPVTNAQYLAFAQAPDYGSPQWWRGIKAPDPLPAPWTQPNRPRVWVAWVEAMAYCRWLTARCRAAGLIAAGDQIRLPTEVEWEGAVRAGTGREYPWGDGYRVGHANVDETSRKDGPHHLGQTTAVGLYPQGVSPSGLLDCAGNVWEWCLNKFDTPEDTDTSGKAGRSLRGGSWRYDPALARAVFRPRSDPGFRNLSVGFRLVCACPIPLTTEPLNTDH